jgi:hypothetical protein
MRKQENMDSRIKSLLSEGPLVALYFVTGINVLKEQVDAMSDEEITAMFSKFLHLDRVRNSLEYLYRALNALN